MPNQPSKTYSMYYKHYELPENFPLVGLLGRDWITDDQPIKSMHFHNCLEIGFCYDGDGIFIIEDKIINFHKNDISIVFPNQLHRSTSCKHKLSKWKWLYLDPEKLISDIIPVSQFDFDRFRYAPTDFSPIISDDENRDLKIILGMIIGELENHKSGYQQVVKSLSVAFLINLYRLMPERISKRKVIDNNVSSKVIIPAIDRIARSYMEKITIEELASLCHISTTHFRRVFKEVMKCTPLEYLNLIRVHAACNLLENTNDSIIEISLKTGFQTVSGMSRNFHSVTNLSPGRWRQMAYKNHDKIVQKRIIVQKKTNNIPSSQE